MGSAALPECFSFFHNFSIKPVSFLLFGYLIDFIIKPTDVRDADNHFTYIELHIDYLKQTSFKGDNHDEEDNYYIYQLIYASDAFWM